MTLEVSRFRDSLLGFAVDWSRGSPGFETVALCHYNRMVGHTVASPAHANLFLLALVCCVFFSVAAGLAVFSASNAWKPCDSHPRFAKSVQSEEKFLRSNLTIIEPYQYCSRTIIILKRSVCIYIYMHVYVYNVYMLLTKVHSN